jgi:hypothetical protein
MAWGCSVTAQPNTASAAQANFVVCLCLRCFQRPSALASPSFPFLNAHIIIHLNIISLPHIILFALPPVATQDFFFGSSFLLSSVQYSLGL